MERANSKGSVIYIPHGGGPLPLLNDALFHNMNAFLRKIPQRIQKPEAIIVISAHWEASTISITASQNPPMLYDYTGFPASAYELEYPAPGHPELASRVAALLAKQGIDSRLDHQRGFDHGVYIPLLLMYPEADIPCIQISLSNSLDAAFHIQIGKALASLKNDNLLILGSGYSFHNMAVMMDSNSHSPDEKNREFESWLAQTCSDSNLSEADREQRLCDWENAPHARYCHPREEHLLPLQVCYGIAGSRAETVFQGIDIGVLSSGYLWQ